MPDETDVRHIQLGIETVACVFKLPQQTIDYLWERIEIAIKEPKCHKNTSTRSDIPQSCILDDPQQLVISRLI